MGVKRIYPHRKRKLYLCEWREHKGLTQEQLGARLGVTGVTVSRWETGKSKLSDPVRDAVAEALGIEPEDLYRHPDRPSADALLRDQPPEVHAQAIAVIRALIARR